MLKNITKKPERTPPSGSTQRTSLQSEDGEITGVITGRLPSDHLFIVGYGCAPCHIRYVRSPWGKVYSCCSCFLSPSDSTGTLQSKMYFLVDFQKVCFHESFPEMLQRDERWGIRATNKDNFILKVYSYIKDNSRSGMDTVQKVILEDLFS